MTEIRVSDKGKWVIDTYKAMIRDGHTKHEALHEVNRLMSGTATCPDCERA